MSATELELYIVYIRWHSSRLHHPTILQKIALTLQARVKSSSEQTQRAASILMHSVQAAIAMYLLPHTTGLPVVVAASEQRSSCR